MSNNFPALPADFALASVEYDATFPQGTQLAAGLTFTGTDTNLVGLGAFGVGALVAFNFTTPGSFGSFDQDAAETEIKTLVNDCCQFLADATGIPVATVQGGVTVTRRWMWTDPAGNQARYADTMVYP